jgi:hypothetical protein
MAAIAYAWGAAGWDGYRPAVLDRPLQAFHRQVNLAGEQGRSLLVAANSLRSSYVNAILAQAKKQLHIPKESTMTGGAEN